MTLKQLEAFYWAATCTNFATAAERLHLSTSSLSKRIGELERSLDVELFDRSGHGATLTPAGQRLLPIAGDLLQRADHVVRTLGKVNGLQGTCRLGVDESGSVTWLPRWVRALRTAHPALSINVEVDVSESLSWRLARGEIDAAIVGGNSAHPELLSRPSRRPSSFGAHLPRSPEGSASSTHMLGKHKPSCRCQEARASPR
jgi:DNA-binding transcriptional LysR family regulator